MRWLKKRIRKRKMKKVKSKEGSFRITRLMKKALEGSGPFVSDVDPVISWRITGKGIHVDTVVLRDISKRKPRGSATFMRARISK